MPRSSSFTTVLSSRGAVSQLGAAGVGARRPLGAPRRRARGAGGGRRSGGWGDDPPAPVPAFTHTWDVQYQRPALARARRASSRASRRTCARAAASSWRDPARHRAVNDSVMLASGALAARAAYRSCGTSARRSRTAARDRREPLDLRANRPLTAQRDRDRRGRRSTFQLRIPVHVIPNPVLVKDGPTAALDVPDGRVSIGYFGFLRRQKGWPEFLRALRILVDEGCAAHAVFVGGAIRPSESFRGLRGRSLRAVGVPDEEGDFRGSCAELALCRLRHADPVRRRPSSRTCARSTSSSSRTRAPASAVRCSRRRARQAGRRIRVAHRTWNPRAGRSRNASSNGRPRGACARLSRRLASGPGLRARVGVRAQAFIASPEAHAARVASVYETVLGAERTCSA